VTRRARDSISGVPRDRDVTEPPEPGDDTERAARVGHRRDARLVAGGMAVVLLVWFALVNRQDVRVHFWVVSATAPVVAVVAIAGVFGAAIGALAVRRSAGRRRRGQP
jgi:uncharacterized integral membrane protein